MRTVYIIGSVNRVELCEPCYHGQRAVSPASSAYVALWSSKACWGKMARRDRSLLETRSELCATDAQTHLRHATIGAIDPLLLTAIFDERCTLKRPSLAECTFPISFHNGGHDVMCDPSIGKVKECL